MRRGAQLDVDFAHGVDLQAVEHAARDAEHLLDEPRTNPPQDRPLGGGRDVGLGIDDALALDHDIGGNEVLALPEHRLQQHVLPILGQEVRDANEWRRMRPCRRGLRQPLAGQRAGSPRGEGIAVQCLEPPVGLHRRADVAQLALHLAQLPQRFRVFRIRGEPPFYSGFRQIQESRSSGRDPGRRAIVVARKRFALFRRVPRLCLWHRHRLADRLIRNGIAHAAPRTASIAPVASTLPSGTMASSPAARISVMAPEPTTAASSSVVLMPSATSAT